MSQGFTQLPTTGTLSGLTAVQSINTNEAALNTWHAGASAPASPSANQVWIDTTNNLIKQYNNAASTWIVKGTMDAPMWGALLAQVVGKSANYTVVDADNGTVFQTTGTWTLTLPQASSLKIGNGFKLAVDNGPGAGVVTITPTTSTIDGAASLALQAGDKAIIYTDGTNYFTAVLYRKIETLAHGGTGADLSATGGANQVVKQTSAGGVLAVAALTLGDLQQVTPRFKLLNTSRDMTAASGTASVAHGVTGTPKFAVLVANVETTDAASWGASDGTTNNCVRQIANTGISTIVVENLKTTAAVWLGTNNNGTDTDYQFATVTFDSTNVNLVWTKTGAPTGTGSVLMALYF